MNEIHKKPITTVGYNFIDPKFLPAGRDEYHLRNMQNNSTAGYRNLSAYEIQVLVRNNNTSDDWNKLQVSHAFNPELVKNCKFFGLVRIGKLEPLSLEYHNVCLPVGLYNSTILSCDFGDNVVVNNVNYMSHYIIGNEVMLSNIHELHVTDHAKFGNGIIKEGEAENVRVWVEVCNENAGRKILPFVGMLPGDAYLWSKYRDNAVLMQSFTEFTEKKFDKLRGYYGKIGDRCVIKNTSIIKDVWIGSDAYIKGANKLKNLTVNSSASAPSQIGEGCELVNGIIDFGCRIFYGVKAVRFVMASQSQLKYGARLINSYLGNNSTISCCEVLNSLIFPAHEQHHNNSFLCAALVMGQSNIAAGATIGSNHNSRAADGEFVTGRGFWPGLCVSLKHNSKFATFTLLAKGDYQYELDVPLPFSLVSNDEANNQLLVMPAYWFMYNLYALARNAAKYIDRDNRVDKTQMLEFDFLAPDSINEIFTALALLKKFTALSVNKNSTANASEDELIAQGEKILNDPAFDATAQVIYASGFENNKRSTVLLKVKEAYHIYKKLIAFYGITEVFKLMQQQKEVSVLDFDKLEEKPYKRNDWLNIGGQLIPETAIAQLFGTITNQQVQNWDGVHEFYREQGRQYPKNRQVHAIASLMEIKNFETVAQLQMAIPQLLQQMLEIKEWMVSEIFESRAKDYQSQFRKMLYDNDAELEAVLGRLDDNLFIKQQQQQLEEMRQQLKTFSTQTPV